MFEAAGRFRNIGKAIVPRPAAVTALAGRADVRVALLFGSTARDRATAQSDVDVAVLAPGVDLLALAADLARAVGAEVDVVDLRSATIPLLSAIVRDGVREHQATVGAEAGGARRRWRCWRPTGRATSE